MPLDRRHFLRTASLSLPLAGLASRLAAEGSGAPPRIMRMRSPENLEMNFAALDSFVTPTASFFVRSHFAVPKIDPHSWRLKVEGAVENPLSLGLDDISGMRSTSLPATLECAGNGRVYLTPTARGVNWQLGAVSTAEWSGVPLAAILDRAGVRRGAVDVILEGADSGIVADPQSPGAISFHRSLPLAKAMKPEVLLALGMNNKELTAAHGFPLRAVVGGWYGVASVKWLTRIIVVDKPFRGFWQSHDYSYFQRTHGVGNVAPITAMQVKAQIARPAMGEIVAAGKPYKVAGAAWAGEADVTRVEVSMDSGRSWHHARLAGRKEPYCWRLWEFDWRSPQPGKLTIMARATDSLGRAQPLTRNEDFRNYLICHVLPVEIEVRM